MNGQRLVLKPAVIIAGVLIPATIGILAEIRKDAGMGQLDNGKSRAKAKRNDGMGN